MNRGASVLLVTERRDHNPFVVYGLTLLRLTNLEVKVQSDDLDAK